MLLLPSLLPLPKVNTLCELKLSLEPMVGDREQKQHQEEEEEEDDEDWLMCLWEGTGLYIYRTKDTGKTTSLPKIWLQIKLLLLV